MANVPVLQPHRLVYVGLRDIDEAELVIMRSLGITAFTMHEVNAFGIQNVMAQAMGQLVGNNASTLHVSWDIDAVDPTWAPSTGTSVLGGLSLTEATHMAEVVAATRCLASLDMVEVNPMLGAGLDDANRTADFANTLVTTMLRPWSSTPPVV
jgi:arginase